MNNSQFLNRIILFFLDQKHLMELTERALEGMDSRKSVGELQEQEKLINDLRSALHERSAVRLLYIFCFFVFVFGLFVFPSDRN